jgi:hypothetical protein
LGFTVCKSERGADIEDSEGNFFEAKTSVCKSDDTYKTNFIWPIPKGKTQEETRERLAKQILEKTGGPNGGAYFIATTKRGVELNRYFLSGRFLAMFFAQLKLPKCGKFNFGSERCRICFKYHRMEHFMLWDIEHKRIDDAKSEVYNKIPSQCVKKDNTVQI